MNLAEYAKYDGLGLAELVVKKDVSSRELALTALEAIKAGNPVINAVVETYDDCIDGLDETRLGSGPFRGVPFLIKDVFGHEKARKIEFGSRLCKGMTVEAGTYFVDMLKAAGVNILGRSAAPEYSMSATTESVMFGNTSNPWKLGYSAGGSSGGAQAAVTSGMVPLAHGSDIGGSIRIPASLCGGVGLKPSRGRVSIGPVVDEGGFGFSVNFVQARTVRDVAAMLDCVSIPQPGDPFIIPKPAEPYSALARKAAPKLRIGIVLNEIVGVKVNSEVVRAVEATGNVLADMGHTIKSAIADMGGMNTLRALQDLFFFAFELATRRLCQTCWHEGGSGHARACDPVSLRIRERNHTDAFHGVLECGEPGAKKARRVLRQVRHLAVAHDGKSLGALGQLPPLKGGCYRRK